MQGSKKPPATIRRDDRAEPDDEESAPRIDVVNVDGPSSSGMGGGSAGAGSGAVRGEGPSAGMLSLKAQLARLNEQAAAVEKSLDDQRREREGAIDRLERATERCIQLEAKVTGFEAEAIALRKMHEASHADLQAMRVERDSLARAVEAAKAATAELGALKDANVGLHDTLEDSMRAAATFEGELVVARTKLERATAELTEARANTAKAKDEAAKAREAAASSDKEIAVAREEAMQAREDTAKAENAISAARAEGSKARDEASKLRQELAAAKEDNAKDRATARDRIDLIERALDDARTATLRTESQLDASRANEGAMIRQLEAAIARAADAEARATAAAAAQAMLDQSVRRLREEIVAAFARIGHGAAPPPLPPGARPEAREREAPQSYPPEMLDSVPPSLPAGVAPAPMPAIAQHAALSLELDNDWSSPDSVRPAATRSGSASPASKSVPPPPMSVEPVDTGTRRSPSAPAAEAREGSAPPDSIPPPTYASVPPQLHESAPPERHASPTAPPPPAHSVPAAARGSSPPGARESAAPATRRGGASAFPSATGDAGEELTRDELLARLVDPDQMAAAASELKRRPEWLRSVPPMTLIGALQSVDYDSDRPVFDLARQWEREPLCHALMASLRSEPEARLREHGAWLLKHLAAPSSWKAIADLARSEDEAIQLRRWLLEALDRLAAGRAIGWRELGDVVTTVSKHPDASLRDGVVGILVSLDRSDEKRRLLLEILRTDDDEVVLASAVNALAGALPMELDPGLVDRLLGHPSPRVQRSVRDLIERAKQTKS